MAAAIRITVTAAGRAALRNLAGDGTNAVLVASVGLTATAFASGSALPDEIKRVTTIKGGATAADTIHVTISDTGGDVYSVRGFGLYLADGTLFASYGQPDVIVEKSAQAAMLLSADVQFADIDATQITFGDTNFSNPAATTERMGVAELATDDETITGTDALRTVTPKSLLAAINARFGLGAPSTFVKSLLTAASALAFRIAIGLKNASTYDVGAGNGLDADKLDGQEGSFYQAWANLTDVPPVFPPSAHTHPIAGVSGLQDAINSKLALAGGSMLGPVGLFGGDTGVTPPQFDHDNSLATTEFVRRFGKQSSGFVTITGNAFLTAVHAGATIIGGSGFPITATLPLASSVPPGGRLEFINPSTGALTVSRQGTDNLRWTDANATASVLGNGDSLYVESDGASTWYVLGGTAQLPASPLFARGTGYQKLPSGLIIQWGILPSNTGGDTIVTLPIAFPNGPVSLSVTASVVSSVGYANYWNFLKTSFNMNVWNNAGSRLNNQVAWIALGY
jgi:hypothetical protein